MIPNNNTNQILVENKELKLKQISFSFKKLLVQTKNKNKALKSELKKQIKRAERSEDDASSHFAAIKACEDWYFTHHIIPLSKEVANKSELL